MKFLTLTFLVSVIFVLSAQAQEEAGQEPPSVPLSSLLDDNYEVRASVLGYVLILQDKKSVYACPLDAINLSAMVEWKDFPCVDISSL